MEKLYVTIIEAKYDAPQEILNMPERAYYTNKDKALSVYYHLRSMSEHFHEIKIYEITYDDSNMTMIIPQS